MFAVNQTLRFTCTWVLEKGGGKLRSNKSIIVLTDVGAGMRTVTYARYIHNSITGERVRWKTLEFSRKINSTIQGLPTYIPSHCISLSFIALLGIVQPKVYLSRHLSIDLFPFPRAKFESNYTLPPITYRKRNSRACMYEKLAISKNGLQSHNRFYWTWHTAGWMEGRNLIITTGFRFIDIISLRRL